MKGWSIGVRPALTNALARSPVFFYDQDILVATNDGIAPLVIRAQRGDADAFEALVRAHLRAAYSVALAVVGRQADAEDVAQDARYFLAYDGLHGTDSSAVEAFVGRVGPFTTFPYFRAFASQTSWASGAELPILPVLREERHPPRGRDQAER